jgi:glycosyltransferase involved in cell wall biosynthesis
LRTIRNGIPTHAPTGAPVDGVTRSALGLPEGAPVIGFIGRLCHQKAPLDFIQVAARVLRNRPDVHVVMVGSGPLEREVRRASADLPQQRFHRITQDVGAEHLIGALDVLISTSSYEGGPYLPLEAMHAGVPVVTTACPGLRDYVVDLISGLTAPVGDIDGLARATERLLDDAALRHTLTRSARAYVTLLHDIDTMASSYVSLYHDLARPTVSTPSRARTARQPAHQTH